MVTRNEIVFDIFETLRGKIKDDDSIDPRQIAEFVKDYRADYLKQRFDRDPFEIDESTIQYLGDGTSTVVQVTKVDSSSLSGTNVGKHLMRTTVAIPDTITRIGFPGTFTHIGPANKLDYSFTVVSYKTAINSGYGRFNSNEIFAFPYNGYIYLLSRNDDFKMLQYITIAGVFDDPEAAYMVGKTNYFYTGDENYYTSQYLKRYIVSTILKEKFNIIVNQPEDRKDDATHKLEK